MSWATGLVWEAAFLFPSFLGWGWCTSTMGEGMKGRGGESGHYPVPSEVLSFGTGVKAPNREGSDGL